RSPYSQTSNASAYRIDLLASAPYHLASDAITAAVGRAARVSLSQRRRAAGSFGTLSRLPATHGSHSYICDTCASIMSIFFSITSSIDTATSGLNGLGLRKPSSKYMNTGFFLSGGVS